MKIVYLVHGYPPREKAGTEQHCALLVEGMERRGHQILVISATRSIGRRHLEIIRENNIVRIVNNIPSRPLRQKECDAAIHQIITKEIQTFQPDLVHIEHIQFLSADLLLDIPTLLTLHDAWFWCPAGGTLLKNGREYCQAASAQDCVVCTMKWRPVQTKTAYGLARIAGLLHPIIPAAELHRLWKLFPAQLRRRITRPDKMAEQEAPEELAKRNKQLLKLAKHCRGVVAPSKFLARKAIEAGLGLVDYIPNGVEETREHIGGDGFVFLGTMEHHKGPSVVARAYKKAFPSAEPPIRFYGEGSVSVDLPHFPAVSRQQVFEILQHADCLVLGSIWPENAPMIILEARACGCPVIAPNIGGIPELLKDGIDGFLYSTGDIDELSKKMRLSLSHSFSPRPPPTHTNVLDKYEQQYRGILQ